MEKSWKNDLGTWTAGGPGDKNGSPMSPAAERGGAAVPSAFIPAHLRSGGAAVAATPRVSVKGSGRSTAEVGLREPSTPSQNAGGEFPAAPDTSRATTHRSRNPGTLWVTVSGVGPEYFVLAIEVLEAKFGPVVAHAWPGSGHNWFHVKFAEHLAADRAVRRQLAPIAFPRGTFSAPIVVGLRWCTDHSILDDDGAAALGEASINGSSSLHAADLTAANGGGSGASSSPSVPTALPGNLSLADVIREPHFVNLAANGTYEWPTFRKLRWWMRYTFWSTLAMIAVLVLSVRTLLSIASLFSDVDDVVTHGRGDGPFAGWGAQDPHLVDAFYCEGEFCQ